MTGSGDLIRIGGKLFEPREAALLDPDGEKTILRPQTGEVLSHLIARRGELVTKSELLASVWGDTYVSDDSLFQCIFQIRKALGPDGADLLKTVPRKGYRLELQPDSAPGAEEVPPAARASPARRGPERRPMRLAALLGLFIAVALGAGWYVLRAPAGAGLQAPPTDPAAARRADLPSLIVLPFVNISGDREQAYFSDGITDDLITDLSNLSGLVVIARSTAFNYRDEDPDPTRVAKELNVRYVLQGSVQRDKSRVRINARLTDGTNGASVWAERYDGAFDDVFALQDLVTGSIVASLAIHLTPDESRRLSKPPTMMPAAYDLYLRGIRTVGGFTKEENLAARQLFQRATAMDPDFALAYANMAQTYSLAVENRWSDDPETDTQLALDHGRKAVALDPDLPYAHWSLGRIYTRPFVAEYEAAKAAFERAIALNPNHADALMFLALTNIFTGDAAGALPLIEKAMRLNPNHPFWYLQALGMAQYFMGNYDDAVRQLETAVERNRNVPWLSHLLIAAYGKAGMVDEAEWMLFELEALNQPVSFEGIVAASLLHDPAYARDFEDGLRKAGLQPE